ncbi:HamA C-terminal domain-containing protein [Curtobacterium flaccumfaciens]|jgi:hypothetical protein|uniref:HamA C-terminal domain-containing protein n=1 Tax=Curtobacterium flaccumfaciens TaxID=2035 RepID=UPI00342D1972
MGTEAPELDGFQQLLAELARGDAKEIEHLLLSHETPVVLPDTNATVRTHFVASDANGQPAVELLAQAMAYAALEFCVPRARIQAAADAYSKTKSPMAFSRLQAQARDLFVNADGTGEGGELLLFLLLERVLKLPQLLAKMSLKTNKNVHVHGSDGVHARLADDGVLELSWGESKLYKSSSKAISDCFSSIAPFLGSAGDSRRRDLLLVRDHLNVEDEALAAYILDYFDESNAKILDVRWNGVCLIGFDYPDYPDLKKLAKEQSLEVSKAVKKWHKAVSKRLDTHALKSVQFDVFCIPFPSVEAVRKSVRENLGLS